MLSAKETSVLFKEHRGIVRTKFNESQDSKIHVLSCSSSINLAKKRQTETAKNNREGLDGTVMKSSVEEQAVY